MADAIVEDELATGFVYSNESEEWIRATGESLVHPNLLVGVGDCGAHMDRDDGAEWSTYYLSRWIRGRKVYGLEEGIARITREPAEILGLRDRGLLEVGCWADAVVVRLDALELGAKSLVCDLPGDGERWRTEVEGIDRVLVAGETIVEAGRLTDARPGRVLRGGV